MSKESNVVKLTRIEEKLSHLIEDNKEVIKRIDTLCTHVNHELEGVNKRLRYLEDCNLKLKTEWRTLIFLASATAGITAFIIQIVNLIL